MTHRRSRPLLLTLGLALALTTSGCLQPSVPVVAPGNVIQVAIPGEGSVTATVRLAPMDGEGRQVLALFSPWQKADLHHVRVALYEGEATTSLASRNVTQAELGGTLAFNKLKRNTSYRLVTQAWTDQAEQNRVDDGAADAASCTTSFTTTTDDLVDAGALKLKLKARTFVGETTGSTITVTDGTYSDPTTNETGSVKLPPAVSTYAGTGFSGSLDGPAATAQFNSIQDVAFDASGNLYVAEGSNHRIRKIDTDGNVTTLAGSTQGFADDTGAAAQFKYPTGLAVDAAGNVYVAEQNHRIRKITPAGVVTTFAGDGTSGSTDGPRATARFDNPTDVAVDAAGNVYVADYGNNRIRKIGTDGNVTTLAGQWYGDADGTGTAAGFKYPNGVAVDGAGNVFVSEANGSRIRKVTSAGVVTTLAGDGTYAFADGTGPAAHFMGPRGIALDAEGNVYVADSSSYRIRKVTPEGVVTTFAGNGTPGFANGPAASAQFNAPWGVAVDSQGAVYVGERDGNRIRKIQ